MSIVVISTIIIYVALPTMGNMVGLAGIQAEDISDIKFVVPRESQEAWVLDDAMVIITISSERRYSGKNGQTYYALGKVKSSEQWDEILAMCSGAL